MILSSVSWVIQPILTSSGKGMPATVEKRGIGTMVSPWPPSTKAETSSTRDIHFFGQEMTEARAVEHARHAHHFVVRHARKFAQRPHHGVERIGDADDESVGRMGPDAVAHRTSSL